ncbi:uncharacterized protein LOC118280905 [Spodoptera frugiperda]|uniref:Uncharacterized protein LOC118280905 n=1 Tax=Spodoptera frugiperda TaxID=7108 RepID=A0A9R0E0L0_SPOFR|nr:uncharacterized protein LOC118280905 [Spodoptera frugiperda]
MWHILWIPVLIPTLIIKSNCDNNRTHTDVYIQYSGHAEADLPDTIPDTTKKTTTTTSTTTTLKPSVKTTVFTVTTPNKTVETTVLTTVPTTESTTPKTTTLKPVKTTTVKFSEEVTDPVLFVPNVGSARRDDGYLDGIKIKDLLMMTPLPEVMNNRFHDEKTLDAQKEDVVFVVGKNGEGNSDKKPDRNTNFNSNQVDDYEDSETKVTRKPRLICSNLNCNNTINSICGGKMVNREWKYRLFLNECYLRKVNCGFKYEINRYKQVPPDKCQTVGAHLAERPFSFTPKIYNFEKAEPKPESFDRRKGFAARRSMSMDAKGRFCSHTCPSSCPEDYDPECAISATGQKRVFMNHCKLDQNSCFYSVVWHRSPLSECVGGEKAHLHQTRGFVGWMQRVGILDKKGHLVLE